MALSDQVATERSAHPGPVPAPSLRAARFGALGRGALGVAAAAIGLAALTALLYVLSVKTFAGDSDGATVVLEGQAMSAGHLTLHAWALSADSFWSVDAIFNMFGVMLIGVSPVLLHLVPAFVAALVVVTGALIAREGRQRAGAIAAVATVVALLALPGVYLSFFYLRGPLHVGTTLWCLIAFFALRKTRFGPGWIVAVVFVAAGLLGDLQMVALGLVPIFVVGLVTTLRVRSWRAGLPLLTAPAASLVLAAVVRKLADLVGTFSVGKLQSYASRPQMLENLEHLGTAGLHMFGVGSGTLASTGVPATLQSVRVVGFAIVVAALVLAVVHLVIGVVTGRGSQMDRSSRRSTGSIEYVLDDLLLAGFFGGVLVFVALSTSSAYEYDRYLTSSVIFASILAARVLGRVVGAVRSATVVRLAAVAGAIVLGAYPVGAGLEATATSTPVGEYTQVTGFLEANHLYEGLGDYVDASLITVATDDKVVVRPVTGDPAGRVVRYQRQSSATWYAGKSFGFLLYNTAVPGSFDVQTASRTFGPPKRTYAVGYYRVAVWAHPITVSPNGYDPG